MFNLLIPALTLFGLIFLFVGVVCALLKKRSNIYFIVGTGLLFFGVIIWFYVAVNATVLHL